MRLMSEKHLEEVRGRCRDRNFEAAYQKLKEEAETFLSTPMAPPDKPAGFYHNYFCPEHAVELAFDPARPKAHRCPEDGRIFSGEPYDSAWRWFVNNRLSTMALGLGLMWRIDGDERCLSRLKEILLGYAKVYPGHPLGPKHPYGQGKATYQSLDEAVWLIPLVRAYDLIGESLTKDEQEKVEGDLLRAAAEHILGQKYYRIHNIECWHNAAIGAVGICLKDSDLIRIAIEDDFGFRHQLSEGVREDGLWWEGSSSYHFYALAALVTLAQVLEEAGATLVVAPHPLWESERLKDMFRAPVALAYPNLRLPATNDCWFFSSLTGDVCHGVPSASAFYEVAYGWYEDPIFAWVLNRNYMHHPRSSLEALLYGRKLPESETRPSFSGTNFKRSGFAVLRSQAPLDKGNYLLLKYGPHGGSHGHPDKLGISFYASGYPASPDLGTPGYGIELHTSWYRQTLSHNTVILDGKSQPPAEGELVAFDSGAGGDFGVADARVSWKEEPYDGVTMRRTILWTEDYFLDLFQVECDRERQIDWVCRFRGRLEAKEGLSEGEPVQLEGDGYRHISYSTFGAANGPVRLRWRLPESNLTLFFPKESGTKVVLGRVPFSPASETTDILIRRRYSRITSFLALMHPWAKEPAVMDVISADADLPEEVWALWVHFAEERHLWIIHKEEQEGKFSVPTSGADRVLTYVL
jgi:hypothetical protein